MTTFRTRFSAALLAASVLGGCAATEGGYDGELDNDPPLADVDELLEGAPDGATLPDESKADAQYPVLYTKPIEWQSPVKSQGSRGVCSIFSTVALMEHLYIKEGTLPNPDFSEQYLQWSAKVQVGSFPHTSGSNANSNLRAIHEYGIVAEADDPYETFQWSTANDSECEGEDMPTKCYTNGDPSEEARAARKYFLPRGRWLSNRRRSIKAHMTEKEQGAIVGLTFFYQSWNHRRSDLPTNRDYWNKGYVLYPNAKDQELSLEKRAGHSIELVGWDDELEVPTVDEEGNTVVDENGEPVMEKGFFIFKNSWGTGSFGKDNPHGDGYGFISMRYVEEYGSVYISDLPTVELPDEVCGDGIDNDMNGDTDCDDAACANTFECAAGDTEVVTFASAAGALAIPDNDPVGVASEITVDRQGTVLALDVAVNITHTYRGDLQVTLYRGDDAIVLHDRQGGGQDNLQQSFRVESFDGSEMSGTWRLKVTDNAGADTGELVGWSLDILTNTQQ